MDANKVTANTEQTTEEEDEKKILCFSTEMIPCKLLYLVRDMGFGTFSMFVNLLYIEGGLSVTNVGIMNGVLHLFALFSGPLWGSVIDSLKTHKSRVFVLVFIALGTSISTFSRPFVVRYVGKTAANVSCANTTSCTTTTVLLNHDKLYAASIVNGAINIVFITGLLCYVEGAVVKTVFTRKTSQSYGKQKFLEPIGIGIGVFLSGLAIDHVRFEHFSKYLVGFILYLPLSLALIPFLYIVTKQADWDYGKNATGMSKGDVMKSVMKTYRKCDNIVFLLCVVIIGLSAKTIDHYLYLFILRTMHSSKTMLSLTTVIDMASNLLFYPLSSTLIKMSGDPLRCVALGLGTFCIRHVLISFSTELWHIFLLQSLGGVCNSLPWVAMIEFTWSKFPKEATTSAVGILVVFQINVACILSNTIGGYVYQYQGPIVLFRGMGVISAVGCILMLLYFETKKRRTRLESPQTALEVN